MKILAFDLGGTRLKATVVDGDDVSDIRVDVSETPGHDPVAALIGTGARLLEGATPDAIGIAVPGIVEDGTVTALAGKLAGIVDVDLGAAFIDAFGCAPIVRNDAVAYGIGEALRGAGAGAARAVVVTIGTGVGVAVIEHGSPLGAGPLGGGILGGQIPIDADDARADSNRGTGTIEALCAAPTITADTPYATITALYDAARAHAPDAVAAIDDYRRRLVRALVALAHAHAPDRIVVGGGPFAVASPIMDGVEELVRRRMYPGLLPDVVRARLGDAAALAGLIELAKAGAR